MSRYEASAYGHGRLIVLIGACLFVCLFVETGRQDSLLFEFLSGCAGASTKTN
jgi:hypothetical protein